MELYRQQRLLFVYLCGILDNETHIVKLRQVDNMKFAFQNFEEEILNIQNEIKYIKENDNVLELFCIIGSKKLLDSVDEIFHKSILDFFEKKTFEQFLEHNILLDTSSICNKSTLNILLNLYLKHLICENHIRYPIKFIDEKEVMSLCFYSNNNTKDDRSLLAKYTYDIWYQNEKPIFFGKQVITQSFILDDLNGRRIIAHLPDNTTGEIYLLLEGGVKVYLRSEYPYFREKMGHLDLDVLSIGELDTILSNPVYAFNKIYQPYELYEDWQKVLNYVLAVIKIDWTTKLLCKIHNNFMIFMEKEICEIEYIRDTDTIISKKEYYKAYLRRIIQIRDYFSGIDEAIISKDYIQLLKSRYIFLPVILNIISAAVPKLSLFSIPRNFDIEEYKLLLQDLDTNDINRKGKALENVAGYLIECSKNIQVMQKRLRTPREEIDLSCCNISLNADIWKLGALILVECKNWKNKVGVEVIRQLSYIMSYKGNSTTILFATNGITHNAQNEILNYAMTGKHILCIDKKELEMIQNHEDFEKMLCVKYKEQISYFQNSVELLGI